MAYAAVTSLMETLSLNFLQSQSPFPLEDLAAQIRDDANENLGFLQQIVEVELDEASSKQSEKQLLAECSSQNKRITNRLREMGEVKQKIVSLHENLGLLQQSLEKSEIPCDDARVRVMKDLEAQMRDASFKAEERIEMELTAIYLAMDCLHSTACLLSLHEIINEASPTRPPRLYGRHSQLDPLKEVGEVKQKMVSLQENLGLLKDILQKSEIGNDVAGAMKDLEAEIRDVWFKEERIEIEMTTISLAKQSLLHLTACLLSRLHQIFIEAEKQTDFHRNELIRLAKVSSLVWIRRRRLQLVKGSSQHDLVHKKIIVSNFSKKASKFDGGMVGCEKLFEKTLDQLLTQQTTKGRQVVSIVGMGGIGKTTLAHKVYEHPSITSHFDKRAWVTVSQECNVEQMLRCLLSCVIAASRDDDQDQLAECLRKHLKEQRYLIVMDDIWSTTAWDSVQRCFPDDNNGSRILLTSRLREVAKYASSGNTPLNMPFLNADESWNLYCKVFGKTEFLLVFEQIGRDIVEKCKGLPLAITIVASLLSKTEEKVEKWENVAESVIGDSNEACSRVLYLSYNQLPHHLKACFLYFGIFEEDYEISVKKLVMLWAAEGFLSTMEHVNLEKVAVECLQDLVDRSLVIVSKHSYNGEMKTIRIHDMLRDLCLREARHENLLNAKKPCRWIGSQTLGSLYNKVVKEDECFHKPHTFHLTRYYSSFWNPYEECLFSHLKLLRVLDMKKNFWNGVMDLNILANLVHLRYLALYTNGTVDAKVFENWNNMQTLIVSGDLVNLYSHSSEPLGIWKMPLLKNVCIGSIRSLETPSVVYRNLESISWLYFKLCTKDLFTMVPNLKTLGVSVGYYVIDWFCNFVLLEQLEKLSIRGDWMVFNLVMYSIPWATTLPNLKKLSLKWSNLQWSALRAISMLPNLEVLKLIDACEGPEWETSDGEFHRLKRLVIRHTDLRCWTAVGDHFPMLECLELSFCRWLEEIPRSFADITTLALIQLSKCKDSLVASAMWIQEEQNNNYGNHALLVRSKNIKTFEEEQSDEWMWESVEKSLE